MKTIPHFLIPLVLQSVAGHEDNVIWHIFNCEKADVTNNDGSDRGSDNVLLDATNKYFNGTGPCAAIKDKLHGKFGSYEIQVAMLNERSSMGVNTGNLGIVFNYIDESNFDFLYLRY